MGGVSSDEDTAVSPLFGDERMKGVDRTTYNIDLVEVYDVGEFFSYIAFLFRLCFGYPCREQCGAEAGGRQSPDS